MEIGLSSPILESEFNRAKELKAFDDTKTGVKGLVDTGILKVPKIFIRPLNELGHNSDSNLNHFQIPIIDLHGYADDKHQRQEIVDGILSASQNWGFFQVVNHGVPTSLMEGMTKAVHRFNEQDDLKKELYSRDRARRVRFHSNVDLYISKTANWRDSLIFNMLGPDPLHPQELPIVFRDITIEYTKHVKNLGDILFELLSEGLGLKPDFLKQMKCAEPCNVVCNYYPPCPEPELTFGSPLHTDPVFLTILLQENIAGLQVLHQDSWVDVNPIPGAFVVNIGDLLQIISNDTLKSVKHRVLVNHMTPRVSVACFLTTLYNATNPFGPIKELITKDKHPIYRDVLMKDYSSYYASQGVDGKSALDYFKL
ncbi:hypothetical protein AQUCO_03400382v1 [Aquilegia coerulea]|uniref:Fe2OG dioxygenase domain-containing protein n=1 Tax=Aquilegia coerulea TaxID=218851 RepID=A0A2G5CYX2_AQUCA|nr:hypothetical protein AQUCO_03400382v1 [Aquilegia coerulea]